jgi:hypothetical protein
MLGAQVLFGFKLNGVFQEEFANLSLASRYVDCAGQVLMATAIGLLVAPSMQHRIVENGADTVRIHRITGVFAGMALLPFAVSLGLGFYIVFDHVFGMTAAFVAGSAFCLLAGMFWYGLGFSLRRKNRKRAMQEEKPTPLTTKIEQMLTEARVILPGAQALLGFQLTVTLTRAFGQLSDSLKLFHVASLCCVATSRTASPRLEISNAAPASGNCDPDDEGESARDFGACRHGCAGCKMLAARLAQNL